MTVKEGKYAGFPMYKTGMTFLEWADNWPNLIRAAILPFKLHFQVSDCLFIKNGTKRELLAFGLAWSQYLVVFVRGSKIDQERFCLEIEAFSSLSPFHFSPQIHGIFECRQPTSLTDDDHVFSTRAGYFLLGPDLECHRGDSLLPETVAASVTSVLVLKCMANFTIEAWLDNVDDLNSSPGNISYRVTYSFPLSLKRDDQFFINFEPAFRQPECYSIAVASNNFVGGGKSCLQVKVYLRKPQATAEEFLKEVLFTRELVALTDTIITNHHIFDELATLRLLHYEDHVNRDSTREGLIWGGKLLEHKKNFRFFTNLFDPGHCNLTPGYWYTMTGSHAAKNREASGQLVLHSLACVMNHMYAYFERTGFWKNPDKELFHPEPGSWDGSLSAGQVFSVITGNQRLTWQRALYPLNYSLLEDLFQLYPGNDTDLPRELALKASTMDIFPVTRSFRIARGNEVTIDDFFDPIDHNNT